MSAPGRPLRGPESGRPMSVEWCREAVAGPYWAVRLAPGGCMVWAGAISPDKGTGLYCPPGTAWRSALRAHRIAWVAHTGQEIPPRQVLWHTCGDRACVNPAHLSLGSQGRHNAVRAGAEYITGRDGRVIERWVIRDADDLRRLRNRQAQRRRAAARRAAAAAAEQGAA